MDYGTIDREGILKRARNETGNEELRYLVMHSGGVDVYQNTASREREERAASYSWERLCALGMQIFREAPQAVGVHAPVRESCTVLT